MITVLRTATYISGKAKEANAWANEVASVVTRIAGKQLHVGAAVGANANDMCWIWQFDSLAQWEETMGKLVAHADFARMLAAAEGLVLPGSVRDQIYRTN